MGISLRMPDQEFQIQRALLLVYLRENTLSQIVHSFIHSFICELSMHYVSNAVWGAGIQCKIQYNTAMIPLFLDLTFQWTKQANR